MHSTVKTIIFPFLCIIPIFLHTCTFLFKFFLLTNHILILQMLISVSPVIISCQSYLFSPLSHKQLVIQKNIFKVTKIIFTLSPKVSHSDIYHARNQDLFSQDSLSSFSVSQHHSHVFCHRDININFIVLYLYIFSSRTHRSQIGYRITCQINLKTSLYILGLHRPRSSGDFVLFVPLSGCCVTPSVNTVLPTCTFSTVNTA